NKRKQRKKTTRRTMDTARNPGACWRIARSYRCPTKTIARRREAPGRTGPRLGFQPSPISRAKASERKKRSRYSRGAIKEVRNTRSYAIALPASGGGHARISRRLSCHHHRCADADPRKEIADVLVVHADAAVGHEVADRARLVGAVDRVFAAGEGERGDAHRVARAAARDAAGQARLVALDPRRRGPR